MITERSQRNRRHAAESAPVLPPGQSSRAGETVAAKYRIGAPVGFGGMGAVYEAVHLVIGRRFAIKFVHPHLLRRQEMVDRLRREAIAAGSLVSEHIAAIIDFGVTDDGAPFLVMEYLDGEDLGRALARGRWSMEQAVSTMIEAARGLAVAHDHQIVHRDLKPQNLFLCRRSDGGSTVKLLDFGIAKLLRDEIASDPSSLSRTGFALGTPHYMSPEQARGSRTIDPATDIYALGVILYEALTGMHPHPGSDYHEILYHVITLPPAPLVSLRPELPAELCELVHRAMAFYPGDRPDSARRLIEELTPFAENPAESCSPPAASTAPRRDLLTRTSELPTIIPQPPPRQQHRALVAALGALAVLAVAIAGLWWRDNQLRAGHDQSHAAPASGWVRFEPMRASNPIASPPGELAPGVTIAPGASPAAMWKPADDTFHIVVRGTDSHLYHRRLWGSRLSRWLSLGPGLISDPGVALLQQTLYVCPTDPDGRVWCNWENKRRGWDGWYYPGTPGAAIP